MPSGPAGVIKFVGAKAQGNNADIEYLGADELARRKAIAKIAKVQPKTSIIQPAKYRQVTDRHVAPLPWPYDQPASRSVSHGEDPFDATDIDDSDDTTRGLDPTNSCGNQPRLPVLIRQDSVGGDGIKQDSEPRSDYEVVDDEMHEYSINYTDGVKNYTNEEGLQLDSLPYHNSSVPLSTSTLEDMQKQMSLIKDSDQFKNAEKLHNSRFGPTYFPSAVSSHSGRFTPAHAPVADSRRQRKAGGYVSEARHEARVQRNNQTNTAAEYQDSGMTDGQTIEENVKRSSQGQFIDAEIATHIRNGASVENGYNGGQQFGDTFSASEVDNLSSRERSPSSPSPSQHTPRANGQLNRPAINPSQRRKREEVDLELDYDTRVLSGMIYSELKDQPFDRNPRFVDDGIPASLKYPEVSLGDLLESLKGSHQDDQRAFFLNMPFEQWEQAGDWFLARFGDLMMKMREARRAKRSLSKVFEEELANREEVVRGQTENIQQVFKKMKEGGEGVLRGKSP